MLSQPSTRPCACTGRMTLPIRQHYCSKHYEAGQNVGANPPLLNLVIKQPDSQCYRSEAHWLPVEAVVSRMPAAAACFNQAPSLSDISLCKGILDNCLLPAASSSRRSLLSLFAGTRCNSRTAVMAVAEHSKQGLLPLQQNPCRL